MNRELIFELYAKNGCDYDEVIDYVMGLEE